MRYPEHDETDGFSVACSRLGPGDRRAGDAARRRRALRFRPGRSGRRAARPRTARPRARACTEGEAMSEAGVALCALSILAGGGAIAGLALINTGLGRSRNSAHAMLAALCAAAVAAIVYVICGFAW